MSANSSAGQFTSVANKTETNFIIQHDKVLHFIPEYSKIMNFSERVCYEDVSKEAASRWLFCAYMILIMVFISVLTYIVWLLIRLISQLLHPRQHVVIPRPLSDYLFRDPFPMEPQSGFEPFVDGEIDGITKALEALKLDPIKVPVLDMKTIDLGIDAPLSKEWPEAPKYGEGGGTVKYFMSLQSGEEEIAFDSKGDRAAKIKSSYLRDKQKEKRKIIAQITRLKKRADALTCDLEKASKGEKMEFQSGCGLDNFTAFKKQLNGYAAGISGKVAKLFIDPKSVRILVATLGYIELAYRLRNNPWHMLRLLLLYVERVVPEGKFMEWADELSKILLASAVSIDPDLRDDELDPDLQKVVEEIKSTVKIDLAENYEKHKANVPPMDNQSSFKVVADNVKSVVSSDMVSHLKKMCSLFVATGFASSASTIAGVKVFSIKACEKCDSIEDMFTIAVTCIDYFVTSGRKFVESGKWTDLLYEDSMNSIAGRMFQLAEFTQLMNTEEVNLADYERYAIETVDFLKKKVKSEGALGQAAIVRHVMYTEDFLKTVRSRRRGFKPKKSPIGMSINGGSGLGKSSVCHFVCLTAAKALGMESFIGATAAINDSTKHDDSMNSSVRCILMDDINYTKQEVAENAQGNMFMDAINNNVKYCAKAEIDDKAAVAKTGDFVIATCNDEKMFLRSFNYADALYRRVWSLQVRLKQQAQNSGGELDGDFAVRMMQPDVDGVPTRIPDEIWLLTLRRWDFRTRSYEDMYFNDNPMKLSQDQEPGSFKLRDVDLSTMLVVIRHLVQDNDITQKKVVAFLSKPMPSCPHSNFVSLCSICTPTFVVKRPVVQNASSSSAASAAPTVVITSKRGKKIKVNKDDLDYALSQGDTMDDFMKAMDNQVGFVEKMKSGASVSVDYVKQKATEYKQEGYVYTGKVIGACKASILDIVPPHQMAKIVVATHGVWGPVLKWYYRDDARGVMSVWRLRLFYTLISLMMVLFSVPLLWVASSLSYECFIGSIVVLACLCYFTSCVMKSAITMCVSLEVTHVKKEEWSKFVEDSATVISSMKYYIIGCITSFILAGIILSKSFGAKQMDEQMYEVPFDANCAWTGDKDDSVLPGACKTITARQLIDKLANHCALAIAVSDKGSYSNRAIPYKNGTWLVNKHFLEAIENMPLCWMTAGYRRDLRISRKDWHVVRGDVALLHIRCPTMPDMSSYITKDVPTGQFPAQWLCKNGDGSTAILNVRAGFVPKSSWSIITGNKDPLFRVNLGIASQKGMCGAALVSVGAGTISIVGMHQAGYTGTPDVACGAFNAFDVSVAYSKFEGERMQPHIGEISLLGTKVEFGDAIPLKSCVNYMSKDEEDYSDRLIVLGSTVLGDKTEKLHGSTKPSPIYDGMVEEFGKPDTGPCKHNQPEYVSSQPAVLNTLQPHLYDINAFECAMEATRKYYIDGAGQGLYNGIQPHTMEAACKGLDGRPYVNGLNYKSSMGLPYNKSKMHFSEVQDDGKLMLKQEHIDEAWGLLEELKVPGCANRIFSEFKYKDEATKLIEKANGRLDPKDPRIYAAFPVAVQIVMAMVFGPLAEVQSYNPKGVGACTGIDMCSHDTKLVAEVATTYSENEVIDGDYQHFDQNSTPEVTDRTMAIDLEIAKMVDYPDWAITVMENLIIMFTFPIAIVNGVAVCIPGMTTSGHGYTLPANNKNCKFYLAYAFYSKYLREGGPKCDTNIVVEACGKTHVVPYVFAVSSFMTQGDDHIGSVDKRFSYMFNMATIQEELSLVDVGYTDAAKSDVNRPHDIMYSELGRSLENLIDVTGAEFLKRRFVQGVVEIGSKCVDVVFCPIGIRSVMKSLYWKGSFELDHVWTDQVVHGCVREMFFYGEEVFTEFVDKIKKVLDDHGMSTYISPIGSFEDHMRKYVKTLANSNTVRDCERTKYKGYIVLRGCGSLDFAPRLVDTKRYLFCVDGSKGLEESGFEWAQEYAVHPRLGIHKRSLFEPGDARILAFVKEWVLVAHDEELDAIYLRSFPDVKEGEIKSSLYAIGSPKYISPPRGR